LLDTKNSWNCRCCDKFAKLHTVAANNNRDRTRRNHPVVVCLRQLHTILFFAHTPFVVNRTFNAAHTPEVCNKGMLYDAH